MQSLIHANEFRKDLDDQLISKGTSRLPGFAHEQIVHQSYSYRGRNLGYMANSELLTLRLVSESSHLIDSSNSAAGGEVSHSQEIKLAWDDQKSGWVLVAGSDGSLLGFDEQSVFDSKRLVQYCVNWLTV